MSLTNPDRNVTVDDLQYYEQRWAHHNLATIEPTTTASKAYAVGDYLVYSGQLYKVTTAITSGGTIVISGAGANVAETVVTDELGSSLPSGGTTGQVLSKHSNDDGDVEWSTPSGSDPIYMNVTTNAATPVAASANVNNSMAIGYGANATQQNTIAIGNNSISSSINSICVGYNVKTAVGGSVSGYQQFGVAIGASISLNSTSSIGIGGAINVEALNSIAIGDNIKLLGTDVWKNKSIAIGQNINASSAPNRCILIGSGIDVNANAKNNIVVGQPANPVPNNANNNIFIGNAYGQYQSDYICQDNIAIGYMAKLHDPNFSNKPAIGSVAIGDHAEVGGNYSTALGYYANAVGDNVIQLGSDYYVSSLRCKVQLTVTSDIRDKTDIKPIPNAIDFLNEIEPITYVSNMRSLYEYNYKEEIQNEDGSTEIVDNNPYKEYGFTPYDKVEHAKGTKKGERRRSGVSAQNVRDAMIKIYGTDNYVNLINDDMYDRKNVPEEVESHLGVQYECFVPFLIKAIQELDARVKELEGQT